MRHTGYRQSRSAEVATSPSSAAERHGTVCLRMASLTSFT